MANRDNPKGCVPRYSPSGAIRLERVTLTAANAAIGVNDPLMLVNDGTYDRWSSGALAGVAASAASASAGGTILAITDPNVIFSMQTDDGTGTNTAQTCVNTNVTMVTGTPVNGVSIYEIDESDGNNTTTFPWKVIGLYPNPNNSFGQYNELLLIPNNHVRKGGTGTAGV